MSREMCTEIYSESIKVVIRKNHVDFGSIKYTDLSALIFQRSKMSFKQLVRCEYFLHLLKVQTDFSI